MVRARILPGALVLASLLAAAPAAAQQINPSRIIDMHLNVESDNQSFNSSVVEGKAFRMTLARVGTFEIMPVLVSEGRYSVTVRGGAEDAESADLRQLETVTAREGVPVALRSMPQVGLVIEGSRIAPPTALVRPASYTFAALRRATTTEECCVTCGNVKGCGCKVVHTCGWCCVAPCCPVEEASLEARFFPAVPRFASRSCGNPIRDEERLFTPPVGQATRIATRG